MNSVSPHTLERPGHPVAGTLLTMVLVAAWLLAAGVIGGSGPGGPPGALGTSGTAPAPAPVPVASTSYVVQPGDTLWSLARRLRPEGDVRPLVDQLGRQTGGSPLRAGQRVVLP